jgi:hypothetical protein
MIRSLCHHHLCLIKPHAIELQNLRKAEKKLTRKRPCTQLSIALLVGGRRRPGPR